MYLLPTLTRPRVLTAVFDFYNAFLIGFGAIAHVGQFCREFDGYYSLGSPARAFAHLLLEPIHAYVVGHSF